MDCQLKQLNTPYRVILQLFSVQYFLFITHYYNVPEPSVHLLPHPTPPHPTPQALMLGTSESEKKAFIWRSMVIIAGLYLLYLFEVMLHSFGDHTHSHDNMV